MSFSHQPQPRPDRASAIITISVLTALFFLLGVSCMWFGLQNGLQLAPTPTVTATARPTLTPTSDVRATHVAEDMLTQVAYAATLVMQLTVAAPTVPAPTPTSVLPTPDLSVSPTGAVQLPPAAVAPAAPESPLTTPVPVPGATVFVPSLSNMPAPTPTPGVPPGQGIVPPASPLVTPLPLFPTETPTAVLLPPTPTPLPPAGPLTAELNATIRGQDTRIYLGPSAVYTTTKTVPANMPVRLRGRTAAGDWAVACCSDGQNFWVRMAYVNIAGNVLPPGAPTDANPNDARWLPTIGSVDPALPARPVVTAVPPGDFPLAHFDSRNSGRVPDLPITPLQTGWPIPAQAAGAFVSPVGVSGLNVLVSSQDGQYYSFNRDAGNQRWRYDLQSFATFAPAIQDGIIYLVYGGQRLTALQDYGNSAAPLWTADLPLPATSPINIWNDTLFVGAGEGGDARLVAIKRGNPADRREFNDPTGRVQMPAIGQETLYVGADRLWALDVDLWFGLETIWISNDVFNVSTAPVYSTPGVARPAELYVADQSGRVFALDANTGVKVWEHGFGGPVSALAVNESAVFVAGNNVLRALSRQNGQTLWNVGIPGAAVGGPLVTGDRLLLVTQNGGIYFYRAADGVVLDANSTVASGVGGGPAVSGQWLFVPATNNSVYAFRGP
jgi:outer membrane protein assembly factor BamB